MVITTDGRLHVRPDILLFSTVRECGGEEGCGDVEWECMLGAIKAF